MDKNTTNLDKKAISYAAPPFCCEGAPAFRCGEESQLSFFHITRNVVLLEI